MRLSCIAGQECSVRRRAPRKNLHTLVPVAAVAVAMPHDDDDPEEEEDADDSECCPFFSANCNLAVLALFGCPPQTQPVRELLRSSLEVSLPTVLIFIDSTIVYIISRKWKDLLAIYVFALQPGRIALASCASSTAAARAAVNPAIADESATPTRAASPGLALCSAVATTTTALPTTSTACARR